MQWLLELKEALRDRLRLDENLKHRTSWNVGGRARVLIEPQTIDQALQALAIAQKNHIDFFVLGGGTNLLISDKGFSGMAISTQNLSRSTKIDHETFIFESGVYVSKILKKTIEEELSGWEHMVGIPGTLGGALIGNAGVSEAAVGDSVQWVEVLDIKNSIRRIDKKDIEWNYRYSDISRQAHFITRACLSFKKSRKKIISEKIDLFKSKRSSQPRYGHSAGSVFKNPKANEKAGFLLDEYGCKGLRSGGAHVSEDHANFILTDNSASAQDIWVLVKRCRAIILQNHGRWLDLEVKLIGGPWD